MYLTNFGFKYPDLAKEETRVVTILSDDEEIQKWEYHIQEMYCTDKKCDCRKVNFNIIWPNNEIYYLDYGFESFQYYMEWWIWDKKLAKELSWLSVNTYTWNALESKKMFDTMKWVLQDKIYIDRLKKHYKLMKEDVDWYEDPIPLDIEDNIIYLDSENEKSFDEKNYKLLTKKTLKERKRKKLAKKQRKKRKK